MNTRTLAELLLPAFAASDLKTLSAWCDEDIVLFGTDEDERWYDRESLFSALDALRAAGLRARWESEPAYGENWIGGTAIYTLPDGSNIPVRVSLVFAGGKLVHGHFSVPVSEKLVPLA